MPAPLTPKHVLTGLFQELPTIGVFFTAEGAAITVLDRLRDAGFEIIPSRTQPHER